MKQPAGKRDNKKQDDKQKSNEKKSQKKTKENQNKKEILKEEPKISDIIESKEIKEEEQAKPTTSNVIKIVFQIELNTYVSLCIIKQAANENEIEGDEDIVQTEVKFYKTFIKYLLFCFGFLQKWHFFFYCLMSSLLSLQYYFYFQSLYLRFQITFSNSQ